MKMYFNKKKAEEVGDYKRRKEGKGVRIGVTCGMRHATAMTVQIQKGRLRTED
jgi:hypothetical protein